MVKENHSYRLEFKDTQTDGIDNDYDWDQFLDDVGADGLGPTDPGYIEPDAGEGDGVPTSGEPDVDWRDIDEVVPLTSGYTILDITSGASDTLIDVQLQVVVESGRTKLTVASPFSSVATAGFQYPTSGKYERVGSFRMAPSSRV